MNFLQLTQASTETPVYVNLAQVTAIYHVDKQYAAAHPASGESLIEFVGGASVQVLEAANVILGCMPKSSDITPV